MKILLTSTSFQDTKGKHQEMLQKTGFSVDVLRGPVKADVLLPIISQYDGIICGDDDFNREVLKKASEGKVKILSKYGVGLDKIDLEAAQEYQIPVTNCPGVNHVTVSEHVFALLLCFFKNIHTEYNFTKSGKWKRLTGMELFGKTIGIIGLGKIGKEVALKAKAFGLKIIAFDKFIDKQFCCENNIEIADSVENLCEKSNIISLNVSLNAETEHILSEKIIKNHLKHGTIIVNTARGKLIHLESLIFGLEKNIIAGYLTDVMDEEPMPENHPLLKFENVIITPHVASRTYESVERQGIMAVENLLKHLISH